jgi:hypothetical protein
MEIPLIPIAGGMLRSLQKRVTEIEGTFDNPKDCPPQQFVLQLR